MRRNGKTKYLVLGILLLLIGVGYAYLTANLELDGTTHIGDDEVLVRFKNVEKTTAENNIDPTSGPKISGSKNEVLTYTLRLDKNQVYEFTADLVNLGENDAIIQEVETKVQIADGEEAIEFPGYFDYSLVNNDDTAIEAYHELAKEGSEKIKSTLKLKSDISDENYDFIKNKDIKVTLTIKYHKKEVSTFNFATSSWDDIITAYNNGDTTQLEEDMAAGTTREVELDLDNDGNAETTGHLRIANISTPAECSTEGFSQTACGFVLEFADVPVTHRMNPFVNEDTTTIGVNNTGGWKFSDMRAYLNSTTYAYENIDYTNIGLYNSLPSELRSKIINTTVVSGYNDNESNYYTTTDRLYLLDPKEIYGTSFTNSDTVKDFERQLDYYQRKGENSSIYSSAIKQYNGTPIYWWLRSASIDYNRFYTVNYFGYWDHSASNQANGVSPAFRIGTTS